MEVHTLGKTSSIRSMYSTCVLLAYKYLEETSFWPINEFALLIMEPHNKIRKWEVQILKLMQFNLWVSPTTFLEFKNELLVSANETAL
jgi:hypothetical protein